LIPELGHFCLILALLLAVALSTVSFAGVVTGRSLWMRAGLSFATGQLVFLALSFVALTASFVNDDFSVAYVAQNSNSLLPTYYKISAVWGAHEGSFLLWALVMAVWTFLVALSGRRLPEEFMARVLAVMGFISVGFILFLLLTSNPFERLLPFAPSEGSDLNPQLQDFGLIVHPPMLYVGYVGFSVAFAFAVAALWSGKLDAAWARWSRPWTNAAWAFLSLGIALGSWWAYYELGWGGWWFWDSVENASFMPWLTGTALIHSLAATEKRGVFKSWTVLLAIFTFSLSLLGGFIVRSGVLTSVHAFAVDPERGLFILGFLGIVAGGSLVLYALRAPVLASDAVFAPLSREVMLLINNVVLVVAAAMVLLGTLYPLIYEALNDGAKISVGRPFFNDKFIPLMAGLAFVLAIGPFVRWKRTDLGALVRDLQWMLLASVALGLVLPLIMVGAISWQIGLAMGLFAWIVLTLAKDLVQKIRLRPLRLSGTTPSFWGMWIAHLGFAVSLAGICLTSHYSIERDVRLAPGEEVTLGHYAFRFEGVTDGRGANYLADRGRVAVLRDGEEILVMHPEKRRYLARGNVMTEAAIDAGIVRDLYVALGEPMGGGAWSVRVHVKPFVRWVWMGGVLMMLGGLWTLLDRRYRRARVPSPEAAGGAGAEPAEGAHA
jgi:cytochrome c-type biogenesis protein CcmF